MEILQIYFREFFLIIFKKTIDKPILLWYSITRTERTARTSYCFDIRRSTQVGRRGAPAKGVGRILTGARVQISPSPPKGIKLNAT